MGDDICDICDIYMVNDTCHVAVGGGMREHRLACWGRRQEQGYLRTCNKNVIMEL